ncbi:MAG TPA: flippase-like domain-containing protein [Myxococcales bacterium]|nr:flippase-like domain-containing protein [Myxococcales bacterium]
MEKESHLTQAVHDDESNSSGAGRGWLRNLAPWLGALTIFVYLFWEVPFAEAWLAARNARLELFVPEILGAAVFWFLLDSGALAYLFTRFNTPVSWREARSIRGTTYLLTALNWNVGTAAIVVHLRRSKGVPAIESAGSLFLYSNFDALILVSLALLGASVFSESSALETVQRVAGIVLAVQLSIFLILTSSSPRWNWLERIRNSSLIRPYRRVKVVDGVFILAVKLVYFMGFMWIFWAGSRAFGIELPFSVALASAPVVMLVAAIPVAPAGLGTQAAAMLYFWSEYGEKAEIVAFGLVFPIALVIARCLLGLFYLRDLRSMRTSENE